MSLFPPTFTTLLQKLAFETVEKEFAEEKM